MIDERFCFSRTLGYAEDVGKKFFDDEKVGRGGEGVVEGEDGAGAFEAVAGEM